MSAVDSIVDTEKLSEWLDLKTDAAKKSLNTQLATWTSDPKQLTSLSGRFKRFKDGFERDPTFFSKCKSIFNEIKECEQELNNLIKTDSELEKESYNEILFVKPLLRPLNFIPYFLTFWSFTRVYLLPGLSFAVPFLTLLAPYFVLKFAFNIPITLNNYMNILQSMISGNFANIGEPAAAGTGISSLSPQTLIKQVGMVLVTFVQGIIQPYWTYKHLKSIDTIITDKGQLVLRFKSLYQKLQSILAEHGFTFYKCPLPDISDEREATAQIVLNSSYFKMALKYVGSLEVIMKLASKGEIEPVHWIKSSAPIFRIRNTFDFQVPANSRKTISASFDSRRHALLTGPNKGGKSTVLRALSISALLAHTYGCAMGSLTSTPFTKIFVCLKPDDLPGSKSRFEREIEFTANTLTIHDPILIFVDELYHSTNPPDALRSCQIYCSQLWAKDNAVSVISTHLFELVEKCDKNIQKLCCPARIDDDGDIQFEYTLQKGICKVSSVDELLRNNGLLSAVRPNNL